MWQAVSFVLINSSKIELLGRNKDWSEEKMVNSVFARPILGVARMAFVVTISRDSVAKIVDDPVHRAKIRLCARRQMISGFTDSQGRLPPIVNRRL